MDMIAEIRRRHLVSKESISSIARDLDLSRPTVRKHCRTQSEPIYRRDKQPAPMLGAFQETLETWLRPFEPRRVSEGQEPKDAPGRIGSALAAAGTVGTRLWDFVSRLEGAGYGVYGAIIGHSNTGYAGYFTKNFAKPAPDRPRRCCSPRWRQREAPEWISYNRD
ncbi:MAG: hypothetical protein ABSC06_34295 [Rhodopila sp.]|jgi:hypothetical protein